MTNASKAQRSQLQALPCAANVWQRRFLNWEKEWSLLTGPFPSRLRHWEAAGGYHTGLLLARDAAIMGGCE